MTAASGRPILLWAITHPTLVKAEIPLLRESGFEVVVQEPTDFIRGVEFIDYPDMMQCLETTDDPRIAAARDLGPRLRLGARGGVVTDSEAAVINWAFDAIMIATEFGAAQQISKWFDGVVLFRDFGAIPGYQPRDRGTGRPRSPKLVGVPILSGLACTPFERSLPCIHPLGTVVPHPPVTARRERIGHSVVSVFVAGLERQQWFLPWLASFMDPLPHDVEVRVFGAHGSLDSSLLGMGIKPVGRLPDTEYWDVFAQSDVWVYPHEDPLHSHYISLEAISLDIPCVMTARTAVAAESASNLNGDLAKYGIVADRSQLGNLAAQLLESPTQRQAVLGRQRELLKPFSQESVLQQARLLRGIVSGLNASRRLPSPPPISSSNVGPPSAARLKSALSGAVSCPIVVAASTLAVAWPIRQVPRSLAVADPDSDSMRLTHWLVRPGPDVFVPIGVLAHSVGTTTRFRLDLDLQGPSGAPVLLEVVDPDGRRDVVPWTREQRSGRSAQLNGYVEVRPDQMLALRVVTSLSPPNLRIGDIQVTRVADPGPGGASETAAPKTVAHDLVEGRGVPLWTVASSPIRTRGLSRITRGHLSLVRLAINLLCLESTESQFLLSGSSDSAPAAHGPIAVIVVTRRLADRRLRLMSIRIGSLQFSRELIFSPDDPLWAAGTRSGIMGLQVQRVTD